MRRLIFIVILIAIISFSIALYFLISHFSPRIPIAQETPTASVSPVQTPTQTQSTVCEPNQLSTALSTEGAAGNIYANLQLTNTGKSSCEIVLGNTVTATFQESNIVLHQKQKVTPENFMLAPGAKVYSQIHYPNGPQCQNGINPKPISFLYKTSETSIAFKPDRQTGKLMIQACSSLTEKTIIDIWPLSKTPITQ